MSQIENQQKVIHLGNWEDFAKKYPIKLIHFSITPEGIEDAKRQLKEYRNKK